MKKILITFLLLFCFISVTHASDTDLRKKIAQMIIVGFNGTEITQDNPIYDDIINERLSGVVVFLKDSAKIKANEKDITKNIKSPKQLKKLIKQIKKLSPKKLFICIDEEGGQITRLPSSMGFKAQVLSHKQLGEKDNIKLTFKQAKKIAKNLKKFGINVNFAPCLDLAINKDSPIIYKRERAFSDNPQIVAKHSQAYIQAHNKYNILTVTKHFPGHGSAIGDSHNGFTDITSTWDKIELEPYIALDDEGLLNAVMIAHVFNENLDEIYPATLSKKIITDILKEKIGFDGLVITDDMQMKAISDNYTLEDSIITAINAGNDILLFANNIKSNNNMVKEFNDIVFNAVKSGKILPETIEKAYKKITEIKSRLK